MSKPIAHILISFSTFFLVCFQCTLYAQKTAYNLKKETCKTTNFSHRNGMISYYFWEENSDGTIIDSTFKRPFSTNRLIFIDSLKNKKPLALNFNEIMHLVGKLSREIPPKKHRSKIGGISFRNQLDTTNTVVVFRKKKGIWSSFIAKPVLYFTRKDSILSFQKSENKIFYENQIYPITENSYYVIENTLRGNQFTEVFQFFGTQINDILQKNCGFKPHRYLVFANGYRGPSYDKDESLNEVWLFDRTNYWYSIDNRFIERLRPDTAFYIDGSFPVKTSNHYSMIKFGWKYLRAQIFSTKNSRKLKILSLKVNQAGFNYRFEKGKIAGEVFLKTIHNHPASATKDTIDFVCHSMGYAYMMGFIEQIKNHVILGKLYIIAPENASAGGMDWKIFEEVWQYGSNLDQPHPDKLREQDGIAPQVAVKGIVDATSSTVGRIFFPTVWPNKHFVHAHMIYGFDWMFDRIYPHQKGYIFR